MYERRRTNYMESNNYDHYSYISSKTDSKVIGNHNFYDNSIEGYSRIWSNLTSRFFNKKKNASIYQNCQENLYKLTSGIDLCLKTFKFNHPEKFKFYVCSKKNYPADIISYYDIPVSAELLTDNSLVDGIGVEKRDDIAYGQALTHISMRIHNNYEDVFFLGTLSNFSIKCCCYAIEQFIGQRLLIDKLPGFLPYISVFNEYTYNTKDSLMQSYKDKLFNSIISKDKTVHGEVLLLFIVFTLYSEGKYLTKLSSDTKDSINKHTKKLLSLDTCKKRVEYIDNNILSTQTEDNDKPSLDKSLTIKILNSIYSSVGKVIGEYETELEEYIEDSMGELFQFEGVRFNQTVLELGREAQKYPNKAGVKKPIISPAIQINDSLRTNSDKFERLKPLIKGLKEKLQELNKQIEQEEINLYSGELDQGGLEKIAYKSKKIFKRYLEPTYQALDIILLIDESGSMTGQLLDSCKEVAVILHEAIKDVNNLDCFIYGHSSFEDGEELRVSRYCNTKTNPNLNLINEISIKSENYDSWALLETVYDYLSISQRTNHNNTILFMLSDGTPEGNEYGGDNAIEHVNECVTFLESIHNVKTFGIGLNNAYSTKIGTRLFGSNKNIILGEDISELIDIIPAQIRRELLS